MTRWESTGIAPHLRVHVCAHVKVN